MTSLNHLLSQTCNGKKNEVILIILSSFTALRHSILSCQSITLLARLSLCTSEYSLLFVHCGVQLGADPN